MISCSMIHSLMGEVWLCSTYTSQPRTESRKRTKISPLAKSNSLVGVGLMPRHAATSSASAGKARPETSNIFFAPDGITSFTWLVSPRRQPAPSLRSRRLALPWARLPWTWAAAGPAAWPGCRGPGSAARRARTPVPGPLPLHPPGRGVLPAAGDAERSGRHVLGDHRTGRGVRPVPDAQRRHQHGVRADAHVIAHRGAVLGHPVVVHEDRGRADVRLLADVRVAHVGQVRHLGPLADRGVLQLHVGADMRSRADPGARPQPGVRTDVAPGPISADSETA